MAINLTEDAISKICNGELVGDGEVKPTVKVVEIVKLVRTSSNQNQNQAPQNYGMLLSDGTRSQRALLSTRRNYLVDSGHLQQGSIIQMIYFTRTTVKDELIIIVHELDVVGANPVHHKIDCLKEKKEMMKAIMKSSYKEKGTSMEDLKTKSFPEVMTILMNIIGKMRGQMDAIGVENVLQSENPSEGSTASSALSEKAKAIRDRSYKEGYELSYEDVIKKMEEDLKKMGVQIDQEGP